MGHIIPGREGGEAAAAGARQPGVGEANHPSPAGDLLYMLYKGVLLFSTSTWPCLVGFGENFPEEENHVFGCYSVKTGPKRSGHIQSNIWKSCVHIVIIDFAIKHMKKFATKHVEKFA